MKTKGIQPQFFITMLVAVLFMHMLVPYHPQVPLKTNAASALLIISSLVNICLAIVLIKKYKVLQKRMLFTWLFAGLSMALAILYMLWLKHEWYCGFKNCAPIWSWLMPFLLRISVMLNAALPMTMFFERYELRKKGSNCQKW